MFSLSSRRSACRTRIAAPASRRLAATLMIATVASLFASTMPSVDAQQDRDRRRRPQPSRIDERNASVVIGRLVLRVGEERHVMRRGRIQPPARGDVWNCRDGVKVVFDRKTDSVTEIILHAAVRGKDVEGNRPRCRGGRRRAETRLSPTSKHEAGMGAVGQGRVPARSNLTGERPRRSRDQGQRTGTESPASEAEARRPPSAGHRRSPQSESRRVA